MKSYDLRQKLKGKYIKDNDLTRSYIALKVLWQCRPLLPEVKIVGKDDTGNIIFFEETSGSLQKRHYGKTDTATSFNLLLNDGIKTQEATKTYLSQAKINFNEGYDLDLLIYFLENNNNAFNALGKVKRKSYWFYLSEEENELVEEFLKKMRRYKDENNQAGNTAETRGKNITRASIH